ncbi:MAG: bifunctional 23S rRNA (guanine(2069)-N(7))-methyltransferase RlmK/23S rRNA (guanine(2445)-N(2))-methyltransferase RlmL [Pseudomonadota bacterium]
MFFATCPRGLAGLLGDELRALGALSVRVRPAGVDFDGEMELGYRACLWSRLASRILLRIGQFESPDEDALYAATRAVDWSGHLAPGRSFAVDVTATRAPYRNTHFVALRVKDAVVDALRELRGERPDVDTHEPDLRLHLHQHSTLAALYVDLSGDSLHRRGYRAQAGEAPLKENVAAALLVRAGWPRLAREGAPLVDPMCGSGTFLIEAALMAADAAPGLLRPRFGFEGWTRHDSALWDRLRTEAEARRDLERLPTLAGSDHDARAIEAAAEGLHRAGLDGRIALHCCDLAEAPGYSLEPLARPGLVLVNPPYGERMGSRREVEALYPRLGQVLRERFAGWSAGVLTTDDALASLLGLRPRRRHAVANGALDCQFLEFDLLAVEARQQRAEQAGQKRRDRESAALESAFAHRLKKNQKKLGPWARSQRLEAYRLYDADIPEYAVAVDRYGNWLHVQEYAAPATVDEVAARRRLDEILAAVPAVCGVEPGHMVLKRRERQRGPRQYQKLGEGGESMVVRERDLRFEINLSDHLDSGLFLDGRELRALVGSLARDQRVLNLFAYTGSATVAAAVGGARSSTSVDLSRTYLDWAQRNLDLNGHGRGPHRLQQADCLSWLSQAREQYDLIYLDPPTFSTSKRMADTLDVQRDHVDLIRKALRLLAPQGQLIFVCNARRFKLDTASLDDVSIEEWTARTVPRDFRRRPHRSWRITR